MDIPKNYNYTDTEKKIYKKWEESGFFNPDTCVKKKKTASTAPSFSIVLPPPNVTGILHLGHAARITLEDILIRFHRMKGYRTLWLPGTDHAAIATQSKVESIIQKKEKKNRHDLGKREFLKRVENFASESHDNIIKQIKAMGSSVDWTREAYTLDKERNKAVVTAFKKLYDLGLIYRGLRIVNWDPKGQTTVSDDEVNYKEEEGFLYTFYYDKNFPIPIATTRPETKLGDTAVAVNPKDKRYKKYIGETYKVNFLGQELDIKIVGDDIVDPRFGTGALGVTPAHSFTDWEMAQKHNLPLIEVIDEFAKISVKKSSFFGMKVNAAREQIVKQLKEKELLEKEESITKSVARAERTNGIIEPLPKLQWFVSVNKEFSFPHSSFLNFSKGDKVTLKKLMQESVKQKKITLVPNRFNKIYFHWIDNLRDWCISRQIWFGHRVPVYYCKQKTNTKCKKPIVSKEQVKVCPHCKGGVEQDTDTLDTWFSSGLWTFSTLGWPGKTKDLKTYHPTSVLETASDILFFWVARMVLMTTALIGEVPFHNVYLNGMIRDEKGKKMSKSLGNSIDPMEMTSKYGTDALRMSLVIGAAPGNDIKLSEEKIKAQKYFANKIWNATRFVLSVLPEDKKEIEKITSGSVPLTAEDKKKMKKFFSFVKETTGDMEKFRLDLAGDRIYQYFWHTFADIAIEENKHRIYDGSDKERLSALQVLYSQLLTQIRIIHPFMPFITEELWSLIPKSPKEEKLLLTEKWPEVK